MRRAAIIAAAVACVGLGACSRDLDPTEPHTDSGPASINFHLQNGGASAAYVYEGCLVDFTITSLADPSVTITRVEGCVCECGRNVCPVCGACYAGPREILAGQQLIAPWVTARVTNETGPTGACQRLYTLPAGSYRIEVPVYAFEADAAAKVLPRVVTQVFTLPAPNDTVVIPVGSSR